MSRRLVIAHPSADLYGSDLQLLETVRGMAGAGWEVVTVLPEDGPLAARLTEAGTRVRVEPFPVLRKSLLTPRHLLGTVAGMVGSTIRTARWLRGVRADRVLVNTLTIPSWIAAARLARVPVITHVHEAEDAVHRLLRLALATPLVLSKRIVVNSGAARDVLLDSIPRLAKRIQVVHNGVTGPPQTPSPARSRSMGDPAQVVIVSRLSPRKGVDVALEAVALLRAEDRDVTLDCFGSTFDGYEWYETDLRQRAERQDLAGAVTLHGYVSPTWGALADADVVLVPSRAEPFGNTAVEAMLAERPLVASAVQGLKEVVTDGVTGLLVPPDDAPALAEAIATYLDEPERAHTLAAAGRADALNRFTPERYQEAMNAAIIG